MPPHPESSTLYTTMSQGGFAIVDVDDEVSFRRVNPNTTQTDSIAWGHQRSDRRFTIQEYVQLGRFLLCQENLAGPHAYSAPCQDTGSILTCAAFLGSEGSSRPTSSHALGQTEPASVPFSLFNIAYYQTYFDVDTNTVLKRVALSMLPRANFITEACNGSIDLYGGCALYQLGQLKMTEPQAPSGHSRHSFLSYTLPRL